MDPITIGESLSRFLIQLEADGRSPHTANQYARHVRLLARWFDQEEHSGDITEIDHELLARFLASKEARTRPDGRPKRATSVNALRSSIKGFFGYLDRAGIVDRNPTRLLRRASAGATPPRAITEAEEKRLLRILRDAPGKEARRDRMLIELMLATGIRLSSALAITVGDVDVEESVLLVRRTKGGRPLQVFMAPGIRDQLAAYLGDRGTGFVFPGKDGLPISPRHAQRRFRMWRERARIRDHVTAHSLRHAFAMRLYDRTGDLPLVKTALGHQSITSTIVYAHASASRLQMAIS